MVSYKPHATLVLPLGKREIGRASWRERWGMAGGGGGGGWGGGGWGRGGRQSSGEKSSPLVFIRISTNLKYKIKKKKK